ncbi:MAG TPA: zinc-finger domain-containing protein [Beijerinckiaceae bacterium]
MAETGIPHFHNDPGVPVIHLGSREFMCIGARPPFDHPHVFLDMGSDDEIICPYCSTLFRHRAGLKPGQAEPAECLFVVQAETPYDLAGARGSDLR